MKTHIQQQCVLVAAVCGHERLHEKLGEREAAHAIERCLNRMGRVTSGYQGRVLKTTGDETGVLFEDAQDALQAACEMQRRVDHLPPVSGIKIEARIGCHADAACAQQDALLGEGLQLAARIARSARPGQILVTAQTIEALPPGAREATRPTPLVNDANLKAFEVIWRPASEGQVQAPRRLPQVSAARLRLRYRGREWLVDSEHNIVALGRDAQSDVHISDRRASRRHARIERRPDKLVIIDESTNGTYVAVNGEDLVLLKREEFILRGRGRISFGHAGMEGDTESVEYEVLN